jgi:hypothetical protein
LKQLQTLKNDLSKTRIVQTKNPEIEAEEISVLIESFAFTSNNVTYGNQFKVIQLIRSLLSIDKIA